MEKGKGEEKITRPNFFPSTVRLARPYLSGSDRRRLQLRTGETGVPGAQRKVYPCFQTWPCARSPEQFPPPQPRKVFFFLLLFSPPLLRPLLPRLQVSSDSLFSALFLLLSVVQPLHALLSPGFCLFRFQRALSRTPHFVSRGGSEGARGRESERERQRQGEGTRAQRGECVTSRGGS